MGSGYWFGLILSTERGEQGGEDCQWWNGCSVGLGPCSYGANTLLPDRHSPAFRIDGLPGLRLLLDLPRFGRHFEEMSLHRVKLGL